MTRRFHVTTLMTAAVLATAGMALAGQTAKSTGQTAKPPAPAAPKTTTPAKPAGTQTTAKPAAKPAAPAASKAALRNPLRLKDVAPAVFKAVFTTTKGDFVIEVHRDWAPKGADRFYNLVKYGYYDASKFFRVLPNFMVQFGINGDPILQAKWRDANITDDPVTQSNKRGTISFATAGPGTRTTQVFINYKDNVGLDSQGFAPFGTVLSGMDVVDKINAEYRERPDQGRIQAEGNKYLTVAFPRLDGIVSTKIQP